MPRTNPIFACKRCDGDTYSKKEVCARCQEELQDLERDIGLIKYLNNINKIDIWKQEH